MNRLLRSLPTLFCAVALLSAAGCATRDILPPETPPGPPSKNFGTFDQVYLVPATLAAPYAGQGANERAMVKIREHLEAQYRAVFPGLKVLASRSEAPEGENAVLIVPNVKKLKFVSGGARFWVGAMAGSSAVLMEVSHIDLASGSSVSDAAFYAVASAYGGAWSIGVSDNRMLQEIAEAAGRYAGQYR